MIEDKAWRIDYRRLHTECAYCDEPATTIAITTTIMGDVLVRTMCDGHTEGEKLHCKDEGYGVRWRDFDCGNMDRRDVARSISSA